MLLKYAIIKSLSKPQHKGSAQNMAAMLRLIPAWLQFRAKVEASVPQKAGEQIKSEVSHRPIPIMTWEQGAKRLNVSRLKPTGVVSAHIPHLYTDQVHWYALRVKGDSMTATPLTSGLQLVQFKTFLSFL